MTVSCTAHLDLLGADKVHELVVLLQEALCDRLHPGGKRGTEQQCLHGRPRGACAQNLLHIVHKAHVEHLIALVQDAEAARRVGASADWSGAAQHCTLDRMQCPAQLVTSKSWRDSCAAVKGQLGRFVADA